MLECCSKMLKSSQPTPEGQTMMSRLPTLPELVLVSEHYSPIKMLSFSWLDIEAMALRWATRTVTRFLPLQITQAERMRRLWPMYSIAKNRSTERVFLSSISDVCAVNLE